MPEAEATLHAIDKLIKKERGSSGCQCRGLLSRTDEVGKPHFERQITVGASAFNNLNSLYNQAVSKDLSWRISTHAKLASPVVCCSDESQTRYHRLLHMPLVWRQQWMQTPLWNPPPRRFRMARSPRIRRDQASYREVEHERYRSSPRRPGAESRLPGSGGTRKSTRLTSLEFLVKRRGRDCGASRQVAA
jgi:hypothetical protein